MNDPNGTNIPDSLRQQAPTSAPLSRPEPEFSNLIHYADAEVRIFASIGRGDTMRPDFVESDDFVTAYCSAAHAPTSDRIANAPIGKTLGRVDAEPSDFQPRRHSHPPQGASACSTSAPEIRDELAGRGLIDHSGRARKPIHFGDVHGNPLPSNHEETLRKLMAEPPHSMNYRCETTPIAPAPRVVPDTEAFRELRRITDCPLGVPLSAHVRGIVAALAFARRDRDIADRECAQARDAMEESTKSRGELRSRLDETRAALQGAREARESATVKLINAREELRQIHNALTGFGPVHSTNEPDSETLAECVKKLVRERLTLGVEKERAVEAFQNCSSVLQRVRTLTKCPTGASLVEHVDRGMKHYEEVKRIVVEATARVCSEPGFLLTGIDILKEKAARLQARIDKANASGHFIF